MKKLFRTKNIATCRDKDQTGRKVEACPKQQTEAPARAYKSMILQY